VFTAVGLFLTGREELVGIEATGCRAEDHARQMLLSREEGSYDSDHRLVRGESHEIVLLPRACIRGNGSRSSITVRAEAIERYGYDIPSAGIAPHMCTRVFRQVMTSVIGLRGDIIILHNPIFAADHNLYVLKVTMSRGVSCLSSSPGHPHHLWDDEGSLFAFIDHPED